MATKTPWGPSQHVANYGRGVNLYLTAGHGGFRVSPKLNATIPDHLRINDGWYEEDCDYARVIIAFPDRFGQAEIEAATKSLKNWAPDAFEKQFNVILAPGESHIKDKRAFGAAHTDDYQVVAAYGDHESWVPKGSVGVVAVRGGRTESGQYASNDRKWFLLTAEEYSRRTPFGFVIDLGRHQEIEAPK